MDFEILISFIIASSLLAIMPGPDNIFVLMQSLTYGKWFGLSTVLGLISGCLIHTILVAFGVSAIIKNNDSLFFILKLFGALYLVFLAYKVYKSDSHLDFNSEKTLKNTAMQLYKRGFVMNLLNPKVSLFFLAFFPGFLFSNTINNVTQFYVLGLLFMLVSFIIFSLIALLSGSISGYIATHRNIGNIMKWLQIIVFVGIAVFILI